MKQDGILRPPPPPCHSMSCLLPRPQEIWLIEELHMPPEDAALADCVTRPCICVSSLHPTWSGRLLEDSVILAAYPILFSGPYYSAERSQSHGALHFNRQAILSSQALISRQFEILAGSFVTRARLFFLPRFAAMIIYADIHCAYLHRVASCRLPCIPAQSFVSYHALSFIIPAF